MLTGVLVVAFPVSVFSDLWQKEVRRLARERRILLPDDDDYYDNANDDDDSIKNGGDDDDNNDNRDAILAKCSADSATNFGSETEDSIYYSSRAKDFDTLISNMSLSRLVNTAVPDKTSTSVDGASYSRSINSPLSDRNSGGVNKANQINPRGDTVIDSSVVMERDDIAEIDRTVGETGKTLRDLIMEMETKEGQTIFASIDRKWNGQGYNFSYHPAMQMIASTTIRGLFPRLAHYFQD